MPTLFISGTGTGVGKTLVTTTLIRQIRLSNKSVNALKPVITGFDENNYLKSDTALILNELGCDLTWKNINKISPWRFHDPISPNMASEIEGRPLDVDKIAAFCHAKSSADSILLVEGVGGVMVPLNNEATVLDLMVELAVPVIIVVGSYLGTLSHTLTTLWVVKNFGLKIAGIVISESEENAVPVVEIQRTLRKFADDFPIIIFPRLKDNKAPSDFPELTSLLGIL